MKISRLQALKRGRRWRLRSLMDRGVALPLRVFLLFLIIIGLAGIIFIGMREKHPLKNAEFDMAPSQGKMEILQEAVEKNGIEYGWQLLSDNGIAPVGDLPYFLGGKIFRTYGLEGSSRCPPEFSSGCRAGFLQTALEEEGIGSIPKLQDICRSWGEVSSCSHGFGHGFIHVTNNISSAISYCNKYVAGEGDRRRCWLGVFQEDEKIYQSSSGYSDMWGLCTGMPEEYQGTCAFALETKMLETMGLSLSQIAEICTSSNNSNVRRGCIVGLAHSTEMSAGGTEFIEDNCNSMFPAEEEKAACIIGAAEFAAWFPREGMENTPAELCETVTGMFRDQCADAISSPNQMKSLDAAR